jgi:hypothetical protein
MVFWLFASAKGGYTSTLLVFHDLFLVELVVLISGQLDFCLMRFPMHDDFPLSIRSYLMTFTK